MRYRVREGSIADYGRYALTGIAFGIVLGLGIVL